MRNKKNLLLYGPASQSILLLALAFCGLSLPMGKLGAQTTTLAGPEIGKKEAASKAPPDDEEIFQESENPFSKRISLPIQNNSQFNSGTANATDNVIKFQPVIPLALNKDWVLITRTILPLINQPSHSSGSSSAFGLGDLNPQFYFSPAKAGAFVWGFGPTFTLPTGTESSLTNGQWDAGPALGINYTRGPLVAGLLINNQWSFAGWEKSSFNQLSLSPSVSYNLVDGWYLTYSPTITANWEADSDNRWTVPVGGGFGKLIHIDDQTIKISFQAFNNVLHPGNSSDWSVRFQVQFFFPN